MTVDPMFLDQNLQVTFEKVSSQIKLSDNPDRWQAEVSTQIYAFVPYLADYEINIVFDKVDAQRGAAIGRVEVTPRSEAATKDEQESLPKILIPLVVTDRMLQPVDIFMDGEGVYPLSEWRLKEQLMRPTAFETSTRQPTDQGMVDQLYPPMRTNYGYGNAVATGVGMGGFGKFASMLYSISHTLSEGDIADFVQKFDKDPELALLAARDPEFQKLAFIVAAATPAPPQKTAEALVDSIKPTVIQMQKLASGDFRVKWANRRAFLEKTADFPPEQAGNMAGTDKVMELAPGSTITMSTEKVQKTNLSNERVEVIKDFGQYRCQTEPDNQQVVGWVLPVMDFEMHPLPLFLFTDGQSYSLQDEIAGSRVGHNLELPQAEPQGDGCFYYVDNERAVALLPVTIMSATTSPDGSPGYAVETAFGDQLQITMMPNLHSIQMLPEDGSIAIPDTMLWMPLQTATHLAKTPEDVGNVVQGQQAGGAVDITPSGQDQVSLDGAPMAKVARDQREFISHAQAEFLLVAAGADPFEVREKLAHAHRYGEAQVTGLLPVTPLADVHRDMVKQAAQALADFPYDLKRDMVKEAAALNDANTADKVLSLGFLNPENIALFASYLPHLDDASKKLAEMLLAARLGQRQINEESVERCMHHMEKVILCLRALNQKERM